MTTLPIFFVIYLFWIRQREIADQNENFLTILLVGNGKRNFVTEVLEEKKGSHRGKGLGYKQVDKTVLFISWNFSRGSGSFFFFLFT